MEDKYKSIFTGEEIDRAIWLLQQAGLDNVQHFVGLFPDTGARPKGKNDGDFCFVGPAVDADQYYWNGQRWTAGEQHVNILVYLDIDQAEHDRREAELARTIAEDGRVQAERARVQEEIKRVQRAEEDHEIADGDHTRAEQDHTRATTDHGTAVEDHTKAEQDHTCATTDHGTAVEDHTKAEQDHTRATGDHTRAEQDHEIADDDHTIAVEDHAISASQQRQFEQSQIQRQQTFETDENLRQQVFNAKEEVRQQTFETNENLRQQAFNAKEEVRQQATEIVIQSAETITEIQESVEMLSGRYWLPVGSKEYDMPKGYNPIRVWNDGAKMHAKSLYPVTSAVSMVFHTTFGYTANPVIAVGSTEVSWDVTQYTTPYDTLLELNTTEDSNFFYRLVGADGSMVTVRNYDLRVRGLFTFRYMVTRAFETYVEATPSAAVPRDLSIVLKAGGTVLGTIPFDAGATAKKIVTIKASAGTVVTASVVPARDDDYDYVERTLTV